MPIIAFCVMLQAGFNNPWSVNLSTMEMTSQCSKLKWNQEPRFHCKVLNILTSFLLSIRVRAIENCCRFVFHNNIARFWSPFTLKFSENRAREKEKNKLRHHDVISMVCTLFEQSSQPIRAREKYLLTWCIKYF